MILDEAAILDGASANLATGLPATFGETAAAEWGLAVDQKQFLSAHTAVRDAYDDYIDEIYRQTGQRPVSPFLRRERGKFAGLKSLDAREREFLAEVEGLRGKFPGIRVRTPESIREDIGKARADQRAAVDRLRERSVDFGAGFGGFLGQVAGTASDPFVLSTSAFGAAWSGSILRFALTEGAIAAGTEIPIQAVVQTQRQQFGENPDLGEAAENVLFAGAGGFLLGGLLRGAAPAVRATRDLVNRARALPNRTAAVRDAEAYLDARVSAEELNPYAPTARGEEEHALRLEEAYRAVREEGRIADLGPSSQSVRRELLSTAARTVPPAEVAPEHLGQIAREIKAAALAREVATEQQRALADTVATALEDPERLAALRADLRKGEERLQGLLSFLRENGGIAEEAGELGHLGLNARTLPGLLRRKGQSLDDAALAAQQAGYFPGRNLETGDRVTPNDLLEAIRSELAGERVFREKDRFTDLEQRARRDLLEGLNEAGIDINASPEIIAARVEEIQRSARQAVRGAEAARLSQAGADAADIDERLAFMDEEDLIAETELRRRFEGRGSEVITIEGEDGLPRSMTVDEMLAGLEQDVDDFAALQACAIGGK